MKAEGNCFCKLNEEFSITNFKYFSLVTAFNEGAKT